MTNKLLRFFFAKLRNYKQKVLFQKSLRDTNPSDNLKVVVGTGGIFENGWLPSEYHFLNLLKPQNWEKYFKDNSISNIYAEHVWEHLTYDDGCIGARTCFRFLKYGGGKLRIAVPDGFQTSKEYIEYVKPGGHGAGAYDHKVLYTYKTISEMLGQAGFEVVLLEYFDENGVFHQNNWDPKDGLVRRSFKNDQRNSDGKTNYTSLIVDAIKK